MLRAAARTAAMSTSQSHARRKSLLYTRKGDKATTQLYGGRGRVPKDAAVFEALGSVDELSSTIGVARAALRGAGGVRGLDACLRAVQSVLLDVGSHVGGYFGLLPLFHADASQGASLRGAFAQG